MFLSLAAAAFGQARVPRFTSEGLPHREDGKLLLFAPGMIVTLYGEDLGPGPGVRVLVDGREAELLYASAKQVNFKIPEDAPEEGSAPIEVCVRDKCSDPVVFRFSLRKAFIRLAGHAYVHMPVWIEVEQPWSDIHYPYNIFPLDFGGARFEVLYQGKPQAPLRSSTELGHGGTMAPRDSPWGRLPLHLLYRFDQPGVYSVRFTGRSYKYPGAIEIATQSDWIDIVVEPYSDAQRAAWLASQAARAQSASIGELVGDVIPSLLAWPGRISTSERST